MLILLPPSETKRDGGAEGTRLDLAALAFPGLTRPRRAALRALRELSRDEPASMRALRLGPRQAAEARRNRTVTTSPTLPAIDRYDGVLYDALDAATLPVEARAFAAGRLAIASALFGLTDALDPIPAYRLSHDSRLPGVPLRALWRESVAAVLAGTDGLVLDLRSEAYAALGPVPPRPGSVLVRVVADGPDGVARALNHFNKHAKGELVRRLLLAGVDHPDVGSLLAWSAAHGIRLRPGRDGELELAV